MKRANVYKKEVENFARQLKRERIEKRLTQAKFAEFLKVPLSTYKSWELGKCLPEMSRIDDLEQILPNSFLSLYYSKAKMRK